MSMSETICLNPATGQELGRVPLQGPEDVVAAAQAARAAHPAWAATPIKQRAKAIKKVRDYLADHADELAETIARDNGKTRTDALLAEVLPATAAANYYAKKAAGWLGDRKPGPALWLLANKRTRLVRQPWGVVGIISPWNYPFTIPFSEVVCGLLAGNCVLLKVASETQMVGQALARCLAAAGLPPGVFTCLNLPGRQAGPAMLEAGVDKLFFTGSVGVGKQLMALAAQSLTPVNLELGGNDAMLVCPDADLERAAAGAAWGGLVNTGQTCGGVERVYVHQSVAQEFLQLLGEKVKALRVGYDTDFNVDLGAMTTTRQVELVRAHVHDALARGAVIYAQSACSPGPNFLPATVLTQVDHSMRVMREETFGPVIAVMVVGNMDQALHLANDSDLGLTGSVWSGDRRAALRLARRIKAGVVAINDHLMSHGLAEAPWGGFKNSGMGRSHGRDGFAEMTQVQAIVDDLLPWAKRDLWWYPQSREQYQGLKGITEFLYGHGLGRRLEGLRRLIKLLPRMFRAD
ncbi:MAG: aldehyde dehydrogenase family protein [Proteobacteria bacterium]|nr:aldehyde dehydrogenase family protein [Pseudomonadota bacterium]MBU1450496.1 aldehyde dehydrogenase family protein [Pseudomonadota bacterium]MBU2469591.1 aldehyde dehydrogenase family protein [Pseudomonadota bacterium]MBU2516662.1 aldehyde dehydrogenase family protein [Pseudomonadota bacterium]